MTDTARCPRCSSESPRFPDVVCPKFYRCEKCVGIFRPGGAFYFDDGNVEPAPAAALRDQTTSNRR